MWKQLLLCAIAPMLIVSCAARQDSAEARAAAEKHTIADVLLINSLKTQLEYKHPKLTQTQTERKPGENNTQSSLNFSLDWSKLPSQEKIRLHIPKGMDLTLRYQLNGTERELALRIEKSQKVNFKPTGPESSPIEASDGLPEIRFGS